MVEKARQGDPGERGIERAAPMHRMTVFGRQGSPTLTLALPFSRVEVKADDAAPLVAELAGLIARLARAIDASRSPGGDPGRVGGNRDRGRRAGVGAYGTDPQAS